MGECSIVKMLADIIEGYGTYDNYLKSFGQAEAPVATARIYRKNMVPPMHNPPPPPPPPPGRLIREGVAVPPEPANGRQVADLEQRKIHYLKTLPGPFDAVRTLEKKAEMRLDDREFRVGDWLVLMEYDPRTEQCTGNELVRGITHVLEGGQFGIEPGYVMLSITDFPPPNFFY